MDSHGKYRGSPTRSRNYATHVRFLKRNRLAHFALDCGTAVIVSVNIRAIRNVQTELKSTVLLIGRVTSCQPKLITSLRIPAAKIPVLGRKVDILL